MPAQGATKDKQVQSIGYKSSKPLTFHRELSGLMRCLNYQKFQLLAPCIVPTLLRDPKDEEEIVL